MSKQVYPTFSICNLVASKSGNDLLNADRFKGYLSGNPHLQVVHKHSFYHLVYFTEGEGGHVIDFVRFPVKKGMIYFMRPGQVHVWDFKGAVDGYIINFSSTFFDSLSIDTRLVDRFPFFEPRPEQQVLSLPEETQRDVERLFEAILAGQAEKDGSAPLMVATLLLQLFITVNRGMQQRYKPVAVSYNTVILRNFEQLVEDNFRNIRLPKEYAALLYITPNHLNALCKDLSDLSAGEVIRNRIVLEAKRLLVNFEWSVGDVARELRFADVSYFVKFFKKYTGTTPEGFRKSHAA